MKRLLFGLTVLVLAVVPAFPGLLTQALAETAPERMAQQDRKAASRNNLVTAGAIVAASGIVSAGLFFGLSRKPKVLEK